MAPLQNIETCSLACSPATTSASPGALMSVHPPVALEVSMITTDEDRRSNFDKGRTTAETSKQTNTEAVFNMLNNSLGVSILAVPYICKILGLGNAMLILGASALVNRYTTHLLYRSCLNVGSAISYAEVARSCLGTVGYLFVSMSIVLQCLTMNVAYTVTISDVMSYAGQSVFGLNISPTMGCVAGTLMLTPFTLIRSMRGVAFVSAVATFAAILQTICVALPCLQDIFAGVTYSEDFQQNAGQVEWFKFSPTAFVEAIPMVILCFASQASSPVVLSGLRDPSVDNVKNITKTSTTLVCVLLFIFGSSVYVRYTDLVTDNALTTIGSRMSFQLARCFGFLLVALSYVFMVVPLRSMLIALLLGQDEAKQESAHSTFVLTTLLLNLLTCLSATVAVQLGGLAIVLRFSGSFCSTALALMVPPLLFVSSRSRSGWTRQVICGNRGGLGVLILFGIFTFTLGNWSLVSDIMSKPEPLIDPSGNSTSVSMML
eukprot:TRINITY_DN23335_c0_g3_i2.p1 TRINITY_DN23335_c0_g3~~TRINITY_DN23335_c0_g3_i2.p1  ORF type:complete len:506 (+),score=29.83 TRINITY_DN23335_c0_g3_i2:52-1518(+)